MATKYKAIKVDGVKHDEHRYLMEQHVGRKLNSNELVHHLNENSRDNRIENLTIMSRSEHARLHGKEYGFSEKARAARVKKIKEEGHPKLRKLSNDDVRYIRQNYIPRDKEFGERALARKYGLGHSSLNRIINKQCYKNVD